MQSASQTGSVEQDSGRRRPISRLRWWIGGILFAPTVINYVDPVRNPVRHLLRTHARTSEELICLLRIAQKVLT